MNDLDKIKTLLFKIQRAYGQERSIYIGQLQDMVWEDKPPGDEDVNDILTDLAGDLNFYEPVEKDRDESLGYYDDERLDEIVGTAIERIETYLSK